MVKKLNLSKFVKFKRKASIFKQFEIEIDSNRIIFQLDN